MGKYLKIRQDCGITHFQSATLRLHGILTGSLHTGVTWKSANYSCRNRTRFFPGDVTSSSQKPFRGRKAETLDETGINVNFCVSSWCFCLYVCCKLHPDETHCNCIYVYLIKSKAIPRLSTNHANHSAGLRACEDWGHILHWWHCKRHPSPTDHQDLTF